MSTTSLAPPPDTTLRAFLLGQPGDGEVTPDLGQAFAERGIAGPALGGVRHLSTSAVRTVDHEVGAVVASLLSMDLGDVLVAGWRKYQALVDAARRTRSAPAREEVLALATHRVTCSWSPRVDMLVDDIKVNTFEFEMTVTFDITGLSAIVAGGDLVGLSGGACLVTGILTLEGAVLAQRQRSFDPRFVVSLHRPIQLLPTPQPTPPEQRAHTDITG
jgi:hypothetical protein